MVCDEAITKSKQSHPYKVLMHDEDYLQRQKISVSMNLQNQKVAKLSLVVEKSRNQLFSLYLRSGRIDRPSGMALQPD